MKIQLTGEFISNLSSILDLSPAALCSSACTSWFHLPKTQTASAWHLIRLTLFSVSLFQYQGSFVIIGILNSIRPLVAFAKHGFHGADQQDKIQPQVPVAVIERIELQPLVEVHITATMGLPHPGDAGFHRNDILVLIPHVFFLPRKIRPWADQGHIAFENVEKLREFIQGLFPEKLPCLGDPRIVLQFLVDFVFFANRGIPLHHLFEDCLGARDHSAVFVHFEQPSIATNALLDKENRVFVPLPAIGDPDIDREGHQDHHAGDRRNDIRDAFGRQLEIRIAGPGRGNEQRAVEVVDLRREVDLPVNAGHEVDIRDQVISFAEDALHVRFPQVGNRDQDRVNVMIRHGFFELLPGIHPTRKLSVCFLHHPQFRIRGAVHESQGIHEGEAISPTDAVELPRFGSRADDEHIVLYMLPEPEMGVAVQDDDDNEVNGVEEGEGKHLVPGKTPAVGEHHEARNVPADVCHQEVFQFIPDQQRLVAIASGDELHEHPDHDEAQLDVHGEGKELEKNPCDGGFQYAFDDTQSAHGFSFLFCSAALADTGWYLCIVSAADAG